MKHMMIRTLLFASGAMLLGIGMAVLFQPITFFAANGATLGTEPSLMSEVRSPGGLLITSGIEESRLARLWFSRSPAS